MQKFVKSQNFNYAPIQVGAVATAELKNKSTESCAKVKLSGYLKKKRNKVGGWRKLWFVLQDKLLLSYPSKEEYDNKLVSFKDVLNLVPGTIVRPLGGFRFTIETASETMYTFRCDDSKTCTEWITGLLDSLSNKSCSNGRLMTRQQFHISLENIRAPTSLAAHAHNITKKPIRFSYSCDSISRTAKSSSMAAAKSKNAPRIPIADATARMLERNGLSADDLQQILYNKQQISSHYMIPKDVVDGSAPNNFRLHNNATSATTTLMHMEMPFRHQLNTVCRINRMFERSDPVELTVPKHSNNFQGNQKDYHEILTNADPCKKSFSYDGSKAEDYNALKFNPENFNESDLAVCRKCEELSDAVLEDQIYHLSLRGSSGFANSKDGMLSSAQEHKCLKLITATVVHQIKEDKSSPVYATINTPAFASTSSTSCTVDCKRDENLDPEQINKAKSTPDMQQNEPIYAVVDLKNKYAHRAKRRNCKDEDYQRLHHERHRPKSLQAIKSDYEEVLNLSEESLNIYEDGEDLRLTEFPNQTEEEENIYEPINIPERHRSQRHVIWKYFSRLNIDALFEISRMRRKDLKTDNHLTDTEQNSTFSDIRRKLGNHRKSIKVRMKKLYTREQQPNLLHKHHRKAFSNDDLGVSSKMTTSTSASSETSESSSRSETAETIKPTTAALVMAEIEKCRRGKKQFFGSLSRLKTKTRASLNLPVERAADDDKCVDMNNTPHTPTQNSSTSSLEPKMIAPSTNSNGCIVKI